MKIVKPITAVKIAFFVSIIVIAVLKIDFPAAAYTKVYTNQPSYYQNGKIHFFASSPVSQKGLQITTLSGEKAYFVKGEFGYQKAQKNSWKNGFGYKQTQQSVTKDFSPGIYLINNTYPFVIKGDTNKHYDITVVFPYGTLCAMDTIGGLNLYGWGKGKKRKVNKVSLSRPVRIDNLSLNFASFLDTLTSRFKINYITDLDMNNYANIKNTNALLFYGRNDCWTFKQKDNFVKFFQNGGNTIFFCTYCMETAYWYSKNKKYLSDSYTKKRNKKYRLLSWNNNFADTLKSYYFIGFNQYYGGIPLSDSATGFHIIKPQNPVFKDCSFKNNIIPLMSSYYTSIFLLSHHPFIINQYRSHLNASNVLAYANIKNTNKTDVKSQYGLMSIIQPCDAKGLVISMGTDAWCYKYNWQKKGIRRVMLNAISYVTKKH